MVVYITVCISACCSNRLAHYMFASIHYFPCRATLDDIRQHPFLRTVSSKISLPTVVHTATTTTVPCSVPPPPRVESCTTDSSPATVACSNQATTKRNTTTIIQKTKATNSIPHTCMDPIQLMTRDFCHLLAHQEGFAM